MENTNTSKIWRSPRFLAGILVFLFFAGAFILRAFPPYSRVFVGDWVKFTGTDAYYHMRVIDNIVRNFPHFTQLDPYMVFPGGTPIDGTRFFDIVVAAVIWIAGLGSPTEHMVDVIGAYYPAVLGALTVVPVYFIGKELFGRWAGLIAAAMVAILPGEFLGRSILGFTDHHVAEALLTACAMLFLLLSIKSAHKSELTFEHFKQRDWPAMVRPLAYGAGAGFFMGTYVLTFQGALLFVLVIAFYFVLQAILDHMHRHSTDYLSFAGVPLLVVTLLMTLPARQEALLIVPLLIALLMPPVLSFISRLMSSRSLRPAYYPAALVVLGLAASGAIFVVSPSLFRAMVSSLSIFAPQGAFLTTIEMQPLLFPTGSFTLGLAWGNFTTGFFLSLIALGILVYLAWKRGDPDRVLILAWSLVMLASALGQRRFAYYLTINVAILSAYVSWLVLQRVGGRGSAVLVAELVPVDSAKASSYYEILGVSRTANDREVRRAYEKISDKYSSTTDLSREAQQKLREINQAFKVLSDRRQRKLYERKEFISKRQRQAEEKKVQQGGFRITKEKIASVLMGLILFFVVLFPNIQPAIVTAAQARFAPSDAWCEALDWLKANTPEPMGNPDAYYGLYQPLAVGKEFTYPSSAYGVMSWWDYGYWITRMGHRIPNANPSQTPSALKDAADFFTAQDEKTVDDIAKRLGTDYVIIDRDTADSKFYAIVLWAGKPENDFYDIFYAPQQDGSLQPVRLLLPAYYHSMAARLYCFDGKAVTPTSAIVIGYRESTKDGVTSKIITAVQECKTYEEAQAYLTQMQADKKTDKFQIIGTNPFNSPVPLEALEHYQVAFGSKSQSPKPDGGTLPEVKVFQRKG